MADPDDAGPPDVEGATPKRVRSLTDVQKARMREYRLRDYYGKKATENVDERRRRLDKARLVCARYRRQNSDKVNLRQKQAYHANIIAARKRARDAARQKRQALTPEERRSKFRASYQARKAIIAERTKAKRLVNLPAARAKEKAKNAAYREIANAKVRCRLQIDLEYKIVRRFRARLAAALKATGARKASRSSDLLGCSPVDLRHHIESQFDEGMSWDNYGHGLGKWHLDHIRPVCTFNMMDTGQQRACFHYTNLRPLWAGPNLARPRTNWRPNFEPERAV